MPTQQHSLMELINPFPRQEEFLQATNDYDFTLYGGAAGGGKLIDICEYVPTPSGWMTMGAIQDGDMVFTELGVPCRVIKAHPIDLSPVSYRLTFDDGSSILACADHQWLTFDASELASLTRRCPEFRQRRRDKRPSRAGANKSVLFRSTITARNSACPPISLAPPRGTVRTTQEIARTLLTPDGRRNHAIPVAMALETPEAKLPLDPYLFGVWLGDGSKAGGTITSADPTIVEAFFAAGFGHGFVNTKPNNKASNYGIRGLQTILKAMGVFKNKHIPQIYLRADKRQRLALLQGLMDTDGTVCDSGSVEFTNTNYRIIEAAYELIVSLGWKARIVEGRAKFKGQDHGPKWDIKWTPDDYVFLLPRKRNAQRLASRRTTKFRYIIACDPVEPVPMRCITVDNPTGLFLVGKSMIPTHNSRILRWACIYWLIRWFKDYNKRGIVAGLFCETFRDLEDRQIVKAKEEFPNWLGRWSGYDFILSDSLGGGMICFRNLDDPTKYRSVEYALMAVDEITLTKPDTFEYLVFSRLRWPGIERTKFMAATNPGGISHLYFKCLWIDREFPERMRHLEHQFKYIKALPTDNPYNTKSYFEKLKALEPNLRRALLEGDWNSFTGQVFGEFRTDIHVVEPFAIPPWWKRWRSNDPGFNDPGVWHWFAVNEDGRVFCYREATFSAEECGDKVPYSEQARKVVEMTSTKEELMWTVTGMDAWFKDRAKGTGKSIIDYYSLGGISGFRKPIHGAGSVMTRVGVTHEYLRPYKDHEGKTIAKLAIFNTCKKLIATLPSIPHDRVNVEEIDRNCPFNHWFDSMSMGICAWHISGSQPSDPVKIIPGSLADILGHKDIYFPPKKPTNPFTYANVKK
jgi:phage terminase large subunit